jgi:long-chain fatty acid transport protein
MRMKPCVLAVLASSVLAANADAQGHRLPAAGARGAGMAGVGVALAGSPLEALRLNPALLAVGEGWATEATIANETDKGSLSSTVGPFSGSTDDDGSDNLLPAFGWSRHAAGSRVAWGVGAFTAGGFGVDYPQTPSNPVLASAPFGLGRVQSRYEVLHVPLALAFEVGPGLSLGLGAHLGQASFGTTSVAFATPDCTGPAGPCFFPSIDDDRQTALGWQVGALYRLGERFALGGSFSTKETYDFEWNSLVANPSLPTFGTHRTVTLTIEEPSVATVGIAYQPTGRWTIALDGQQLAYDGTKGFGDELGFADVTVIGLAVELHASDRFTVRLGASRADSALADAEAFDVIASPVLVEDRLAAGLSWRLAGGGELDLAYVRGGEQDISGPFLGPAGPLPGTTVTFERSSDIVSVGFRFRPGR